MEHFHTHVPTTPYVAYVDEETVLAHPRPVRVLPTQVIEISALEQVKISSSLPDIDADETHSERDTASGMLFDVVLDKALELYPPSSKMIPTEYHAVFNLRWENGLDETDEPFDLDLPALAHLALASSHTGPTVAPTTQLDALLDKHTWERDNVAEQDITEPAIHHDTSPSPQPTLDVSTHQPSMSRSSSPASGSFDAPEIDEHMHSSPVKCFTQVVNKVRMRRTMGFRSPKTQNNTPKAVKARRKRERQGERDAKAFEHELDDELPAEPATHQRDSGTCFAQLEDAKHISHKKDWADLGPIEYGSDAASFLEPIDEQEPTAEQVPTTQEIRTPKGEAFLRDRALELPSPRCVNAEIEDWFDEVQDGTSEAPDDIPALDKEHPELDAIIAGGIEQVDDPFLPLYPEYSEYVEHWVALSSLHDETESTSDDSASDESYSTAKEAIVKVVEIPGSPESNYELENQEANQAFFDAAMPASLARQSPVIVIVENARTSLQLPNPGRAQFLTVGSFRV